MSDSVVEAPSIILLEQCHYSSVGNALIFLLPFCHCVCVVSEREKEREGKGVRDQSSIIQRSINSEFEVEIF